MNPLSTSFHRRIQAAAVRLQASTATAESVSFSVIKTIENHGVSADVNETRSGLRINVPLDSLNNGVMAMEGLRSLSSLFDALHKILDQYMGDYSAGVHCEVTLDAKGLFIELTDRAV